ncbi:hypothetical protein B0T10DRAFT_467173 [Thelonectria olida]|uniref:Uncharacterized protein n=1 Tax=Thelonectria olida TaxID=1576542 RepID=A0A9P8VNA1_9HYPO|nr:hypothetical protein B0T10DRAFT_467173 [Thelonectria olida]
MRSGQSAGCYFLMLSLLWRRNRGKPAAVGSFAINCAWYTKGDYLAAEKWNEKAAERRAIIFGEEHTSTLTNMAKLALTYSNQGRWREAEELQVASNRDEFDGSWSGASLYPEPGLVDDDPTYPALGSW